jgi:MFS transporter, FSR family, fosmidomycin resistance protein
LGVGGLAGGYAWLLAMFCLGGIGFGVFHPIAFALIAKWSPKEKRGRMIGDFTAIGDVGRIGITAALSFIAVAVGWQLAAVMYAAVALVMFVFLKRFLASREGIEAQAKVPPLKLWQILKNRRYVLAMGAGALDSFASASLFIFLPFLLLKRGVDPALLGTFTAAFFVGNLFGKTILGRFVDRIGSAKVFILAEVLMAIFILFLANSTAVFFIIFCSIVLGAFTKGTVPVQQSMVSEAVEHHGNFEKAFGVGAIVSGSAVTAAPLILGLVSDHFGIISAFNTMAVIALLAVVPAIAYMLIKPPTLQHR